MTPTMGLVLPEGRWPVSSRFFVFLIPFVVIAVFWLMANTESKAAHDPTHKGYFERNGTVLGIVFIGSSPSGRCSSWCCPISTWWSKASTEAGARQARRAGGCAHHRAIQVVLHRTVERTTGTPPTSGPSAIRSSPRSSSRRSTSPSAIRWPITWRRRAPSQKVRLLMLALIVPYWVNEILRAFALRLLLASKGLINQALMGFGITDDADRFPRQQHRPLCRPVLCLSAGDGVPALQRHRKPRQEPDRGGARPRARPGGRSTATW